MPALPSPKNAPPPLTRGLSGTGRAALLCAVLLCGCPAEVERSGKRPAEELSRALSEVEGLRGEKRDLQLKLRNVTRDLDSARAALEEERAKAKPAAPGAEEDRLRERVLELEARLAAALSAPPAETQPGPEVIGRLFLSAVRSGDERAMDSLVDWDRMLETALLKAESGGPEALEEFRGLSKSERAEKTARAREEFLSFLSGEHAPDLPPANLGSEAITPLRMRAGDPVDGVWWEVLLERPGGTWKVTGFVRQEKRRAEDEERPSDGDGR